MFASRMSDSTVALSLSLLSSMSNFDEGSSKNHGNEASPKHHYNLRSKKEYLAQVMLLITEFKKLNIKEELYEDCEEEMRNYKS